jgi:hypothetical protein
MVGQSIAVNSHSLTVIGLAAEGFEGLDIGNAPQVFVPVMMKAEMTPQWNDLDNRRSRWVNVFARLKPGITLEQAKAALVPPYKQLLEEVRALPGVSAAGFAASGVLGH